MAQTMKNNFDLEELASLPNFYMPQLNPAKDKLTFYWDKTGRLEFYIYDLETKETTQLTDAQLPKDLKSGYVWGEDNKHIYFCMDEDGDEQHDIYSFNIESREVKQLTDAGKVQEYILDTFPDGEHLLFQSTRNGQMNLFKMKPDGSDVEQLTAHERPVGWFSPTEVSPDGKYIAYGNSEEADMNNGDIYLVNAEGDHVERIIQTKVGSKDSVADWSKDGRYLLFTTDKNGENQIASYDMETKEVRYFGDGSREENAIKFFDDGSKIIGFANENGRIKPILYEFSTGDLEDLDFDQGIAVGNQIKDDRYLFITLNSSSSPSTLVKYDLETQSMETILETDMGTVDSSLFVEAEHIFYPSTDGTPIPAILYKPREFNPENSYPGIVNPHGGPTAQYFTNFSFFSQYLVDLGYVVLLPNVRGSTGYGVEFRDTTIKDWGGKDHEDWKAGYQYLVDEHSVDPDRVGVWGGSYGGFATLTCMTKSPDIWAAGIAWVPVSHLGKMYEKSMPHFKFFLEQQMGDPVKEKELWEERSPMNFADQVSSPLLLIHGENDPRCPVSESRNMVQALKDAGKTQDKDFFYIEYADEGHGMMSDIAHRIRSLKEVVNFLNNHLMD